MPVTKTAKRAFRGSKRKQTINKLIAIRLDTATRKAKKTPTEKNINSAVALADRAAKKRVIHKNKAARIKSSLNKLIKRKTIKKTAKKRKR